MAAAEAVKEKILNLAEETFLGSGDLEAQDAKSFHQYFVCVYMVPPLCNLFALNLNSRYPRAPHSRVQLNDLLSCVSSGFGFWRRWRAVTAKIMRTGWELSI